MFFDGSKTQEGAEAECVLIDHEQCKTLTSHHLEFECTNNTAEYEALVQGLKRAIDLKVKYLKVFGDLEIIVQWVKIHPFLVTTSQSISARGMESTLLFPCIQHHLYTS